MDLEEQTLRYYIKVFSYIIFVFSILISISLFYILNKEITIVQNPISIEMGESIEKVLKKNIINLSETELYFVKIYYLVNFYLKNEFIHFGEFNLNKKISLNEFFNIVYKPSNNLNKITIVEGWSFIELQIELKKHFENFHVIPYEDILADTYYYENNNNFKIFTNNLKKIKNNYFNQHKNNEILKIFSKEEIIIIGSLIEKEGLDDFDKKNISSVIFNRLNKKMRLQIDATVLYAITDGKYDLNRKILLDDLKTNHPFNTYKIYGLPPKPISYVGKSTLDLIFENYKTDFLFYFFNNSLKRHMFSKTFMEHKQKLNEYRNKK